MRPDEHRFYTDDDLLYRQHRIDELVLTGKHRLRNADARRHLVEGLQRRHGMLQHSRIHLRENCPTNATAPLDLCAAMEVSIHVNAYYINLRGGLDNLSWCLQHEQQLLPGVSETIADGRSRCHLFGDAFLAALGQQHAALAGNLRGHVNWARRLAMFRDPAAHRIPLYVPPGVITTEEELREYRRREELASRPVEELDGHTRTSFLLDAMSIAKFAPIMITSDPGVLAQFNLPDQFVEDHDHYLSCVLAVLESL